MSFGKFFLHSLLLVIAISGVAAVVVNVAGAPGDGRAATAGIAIAYGNALLGMAVLAWAWRRSPNQFFGAFYGSMIFRFLLIFSILFLLIGAFQMRRVALVMSLVATYFLLLLIEIFHMLKAERMRKVQQ